MWTSHPHACLGGGFRYACRPRGAHGRLPGEGHLTAGGGPEGTGSSKRKFFCAIMIMMPLERKLPFIWSAAEGFGAVAAHAQAQVWVKIWEAPVHMTLAFRRAFLKRVDGTGPKSLAVMV